jgi:RNA polymerase sigma factor (sigma-70 family)
VLTPSAEHVPAHRRADEPGCGGELVELVERLRPRLRRAFYRFHVPIEDSEDIVQSALLAALTRWQEIEDPEGWLVGTICTMCRTRRRGKFWRNVRRMDAVQVERLAPMSPAPQLRRQMLADIERLTRPLSASERAVLYLRFQLGMGPLEVAQVLDADPIWVRQLLHRVLRRLRRQIAVDRRAG